MASEVDLDFDKLTKYSLACLRSNDTYPGMLHDTQWIIRVVVKYFFYTCFAIHLTFTMLSIEDMKNNIIGVCNVASMIVICGVITFKGSVLLKYNKTFSVIIADVKKYYEKAKHFPEEERRIVEKFALLGKRVTVYWVMLSSSVTLAFLLPPVIGTAFYRLKGTPRYIRVVKFAFPKVITESVNNSTLFWIEWCEIAYWLYYSVCMYLGLVPLGPIFMLSVSARLDILKIKVTKIFLDNGNVVPAEERTAMLRQIAIELQAIYDFVDNLKICLKVLYEFTLKGTSLITPVLGYVLLEARALRKRQLRLESAALFIGAIIICSMPCYYADQLVEKSSELSDAVYMSNWEILHEKKTRNTLLVLLTRLQRTVAIRTIFVTLSLEALTDVINQSYALFSVLYAILG